MKRDLFVFAGQSNMMGASVYEPKAEITLKSSYEYKHKPKRLGAPVGSFVSTPYPAGEFSYSNLDKAYSKDMVNDKGESLLAHYLNNTYFCPAMSNLKSESEKSVYQFIEFSEATAKAGATLAPFLAEKWEELGNCCAYTHIAKGCVSVGYYLTPKMSAEYGRRIAEYNEKNGTHFSTKIEENKQMPGAAEYCFEKCKDFFIDAEMRFPSDDLSNKCFFWIQGETDANTAAVEYETKLDILWEELKKIGFTHFFCIRIGYFGAPNIHRIMTAQENFTVRHEDAYMLTRVLSYMPFCGHDCTDWFLEAPSEEYRECRDSFYGFNNQHVNEKGFSVIAEHSVANLERVLRLGQEPILEKENVSALLPESK